MSAPERIRVAQDADGFWTCREAVSGSQEYVRADLVPLNSKCPHCDGTGDVHRADGEWLGECDCGSEFRHAFDVEASPSKAFRIIQIHTTRIAALEAENARLTKEVEFWQSSDKASSEYIEAMRAARTEASAAVKVGPLAHVIAEMLERAGEPRPNGDILHDILAQAIPAALSPSAQQDAEAVAWLYDWADDDGVTHTEASVQSVRTVNFKPVFNVRPLYTHPPAPAVTEAQIEAAARNIASLYGSPDECVQGSGGSGTSGVSFQCQKRAWENYVAHARAALQAIEVKK